ncbi:MAG TPA: shikimate dehydrogenase [Rhizomicrobium sp.]
MSLTAHGRIAGIVGWPVAHSLSPLLHRHWLRELAIDGAYLALPVARIDFSNALNGLRKTGFRGVNVTVPHKEAAFALAHEADATARAAGAVNLLLFRNERFVGCNTDVAGLRTSLAETLGADGLHGRAVLLLGAGGAARAAVLACDLLQASDIRVASRRIGRADALVSALKPHVGAQLRPFAWSDWSKAAANVRLLVNATSAGMKGAAELALNLDALTSAAAVCDLVYNPLETKLLKSARAKGHVTIDGLGMLMHQAVPAFEAFYGVTPYVGPALRLALEAELRRAG